LLLHRVSRAAADTQDHRRASPRWSRWQATWAPWHRRPGQGTLPWPIGWSVGPLRCPVGAQHSMAAAVTVPQRDATSLRSAPAPLNCSRVAGATPGRSRNRRAATSAPRTQQPASAALHTICCMTSACAPTRPRA